MYHLFYQSIAVGTPSVADLKLLVREARIKNLQQGITGLLLFGNDSYLHVLEGEQETVRRLYEVVRNDRRHFQVEMLSAGPIQTAVFPDWTLGFQLLSSPDFARLMRYLDEYRTRWPQNGVGEADEGMRWLLRSFVIDETGANM